MLLEANDATHIGTWWCTEPLSASPTQEGISSIFPFTVFMLGSTSTYLLLQILFALPIAYSVCSIALTQVRSSVIVGQSGLFCHGRSVACRALIA